MLENLQDWIKLAIVVLGLIHVIRIYREATRKYPPLRYTDHSSPNLDPWRWRKPDAELGLTVEDDTRRSVLHLPLRLTAGERVTIALGYAGVVGILAMLIPMIQRGAGWPDYLIVGVLTILPVAMLHVGSRAVRFELYPDRLLVVSHYAFKFKKMASFRRHPKLCFSGRSESLLELTTDQDQPDFKLLIGRKSLVPRAQKRFVLSANRSQGTWLVEGLEQWRDCPDAPCAPPPGH